jgi:cytochrome c6
VAAGPVSKESSGLPKSLVLRLTVGNSRETAVGGFSTLAGATLGATVPFFPRRSPSRIRKASLVALLVASFFSICSIDARADNGAEIYKEHCSACHGKAGKGDTIFGKNLEIRSLASDEVQNQSDNELVSVISKGKNRMPPFERKLSRDEIREVLKYIRSLKK